MPLVLIMFLVTMVFNTSVIMVVVVVLVMAAMEGHLNNCGSGQSRAAAAGPNLILNFPPRCSNAVNSGVAIRGQRADQGNLKFDSITNSKPARYPHILH